MQQRRKKRKKVLRICAAAAVTAAALFLLWWNGAFLPSWILWRQKEISCGGEKIVLENRRLTVLDEEGGEEIFSSDPSFLVSDVLTGDIDGDGRGEFLFLFWKHGYYGMYRPFWVKRDTLRFTQHIFIYRIEEGRAVPVWRASKPGILIRDWQLDGKVLSIFTPENLKTQWQWDGWGLSRIR